MMPAFNWQKSIAIIKRKLKTCCNLRHKLTASPQTCAIKGELIRERRLNSKTGGCLEAAGSQL
jgi:hypothetical protein